MLSQNFKTNTSTSSGKFMRSMDDLRVLRGVDVGSDHHLVLAKIRIRIKLKKYGKTS